METSAFGDQSQSAAGETLRNQATIRAFFCAFWLYFYAFREVLGGTRLLDYLGMSFLVLGLINLVSNRLLNLRLVGWVTVSLCPIILAAFLDPNMDTIIFMFKTYAVALYFTAYFKSMRLTIVEFVCFAVPVVVSVYFYLNPRPYDMEFLLHGRMSGVSEPNFTSLSLIISMSGAFGIYLLARMRRAKVVASVAVCICVIGVVLTGSRAGFISLMIALSLVLVIEKKIRYASLAAASVAVIIGSNSVWGFLNELLVFQRLQGFLSAYDPIMTIISERNFMELAYYKIHSGEWFIGGSPQQVSEWSIFSRINVPHNSLLDIGVAFGKASFYFYSALLVALLLVNLWIVVANWRCRNQEEKSMLLTPMLFLSLLPMYMSLSAGMTMGFILWMVLGAYPLLHASPKLAEAPSKNDIDH
jgi:hypothetical protein